MSKHDKPQFDARDVSMVLPRKAPPYLDKEGNIIESDPLQKSWKEIGEVFARLHGQRIVEVMRAVLGQMPAKESIELLWERDFLHGIQQWLEIEQLDGAGGPRFNVWYGWPHQKSQRTGLVSKGSSWI
jgi:hypothetical protein